MLAVSLFSGCADPDKVFEKKLAEANEKIAAGEITEGILILEELRQTREEDSLLLETLAFAQAQAGRHGDAARNFAAAAALEPNRPDLSLFAARSHEEAEEWEEAANQYRNHIVVRFDDFTGWQSLARVEEIRGHHRAAIDAWLQVWRLRPGTEPALNLGRLFMEMGNAAQSRHWFEEALQREEPGPAAAWLGLLLLEMEEADLEMAWERLARLDQVHPGSLEESGLTPVRDELNRWREAREEMARLERQRAEEAVRLEAERLAREEEEKRLEAERLAAEEARRAEEEAARLAEEMLPQEPPEPDPAEILAAKLREARFLQQNRQWDAALALYWEALALRQDKADLWIEISQVLLQAGRPAEAEATALEAVRLEPESEIHIIHFLNAARETLPMRNYLKELERALERFPRNAEITLALARAYNTGQFAQDSALRHFRRFVQLASPDDPRLGEARQQIRRLEARP